jgi:uncharacterized Zn finger protein
MKKLHNCGAWCLECGEQSVSYGIENGKYIYTCLNCGHVSDSQGISAHEPEKIAIIKYVSR